MTTTAFDDQYLAAPEPVRQPYDTVAILRRNIAALEVAMKQQTERAEAAEAELAKLREQKPVAWINLNKWTPSNWPRCVTPEEYEKERELLTKLTAVYAAPVPAPHKGATHCDDCGLTWLDDGLNPLWCPYCKDPVHAAAVLDEPLLCDTCGAQCDDPWHYSKDNQRHLHACDDCYESCITVNERNARRYLALRNAAKTQEGRIKVQAIFWHMGSRKDIDAAADRLLEGGE